MTARNKIYALTLLWLVLPVSVFAETRVLGKLVKSSVSGVDTTKLYEPIVTITQNSVLGVQSLVLELSGVRSRDSKKYEFYNDGKNAGSIIWKRRIRGVLVRPIGVYITFSEGLNNENTLFINYEYSGRRGFGNVVYVIALEK
jgi:hypothetical protein